VGLTAILPSLIPPSPFGSGVTLSAAGYFCMGHRPSTGKNYCGLCIVLSLTAHASGGFYFSAGVDFSLIVNPFTDNNRPDPSVAIGIGAGMGVNLVDLLPIINEWTLDVSLPNGDVTINSPGFGASYGVYFSIRFTGSCTGCRPSIFAELQSCLTSAKNALDGAKVWVQNYMNDINILLYGSSTVTHQIQGNGTGHSQPAIEGGLVQ
jgi:hypothetical protein